MPRGYECPECGRYTVFDGECSQCDYEDRDPLLTRREIAKAAAKGAIGFAVESTLDAIFDPN